MPAKVYYNGIEIPGTPFVSRSKAPINGASFDLGAENRWGMLDTITLNGTLRDLGTNLQLNEADGPRTIKIHINHLDNQEVPSASNGLAGTSNTFWDTSALQSLVSSLNSQFSRLNTDIEFSWDDSNDYSYMQVAQGLDYKKDKGDENIARTDLPGSNNDKMFNVWITPSSYNSSSWGSFPVANPSSSHGVVMAGGHMFNVESSFSNSTIEAAVFAHEAGHYLGLPHTFQPDNFSDTPPHTSRWPDCNNPPLSDDGVNVVPYKNYMNYTSCYWGSQGEFTTEQIDHMNAVLDTTYAPHVDFKKREGSGGRTKKPWEVLTDIFKVNFQEFKIEEGGATYLSYGSVYIDSIEFPQSKWSEKGAIDYTIKLRAYDLYEGHNIIDPTREYSFSDKDDGTVGVVVKTSAKGIKTKTSDAYSNAVAWVSDQIGPGKMMHLPFFTENVTYPISLNNSEVSDRMAGTYSVTENFLFGQRDDIRLKTAQNSNILKTYDIAINDSIDGDYNTVKLNATYKMNMADETFDQDAVMTKLRNFIQSEDSVKDKETWLVYDINETLGSAALTEDKIFRTDYSIVDNPDESSITYKGSYITGSDVSQVNVAHLDWKANITTDAILDTSIWTIDANVQTYGTLNQKREQIINFKDDHRGQFGPMLINSATAGSELVEHYLYSNAYGANGECSADMFVDANGKPKRATYSEASCAAAGGNWTSYDYDATPGAGSFLNFWMTSFRLTENTGQATLSMSATFSDEDRVAFPFHVEPNNHQLSSNIGQHQDMDDVGGAHTHGPLIEPNYNDWNTEVYPISYHNVWSSSPVKYNVSVSEAINTYKILPSANVEGVYVLQNLQCKRKAKTKISINGVLQPAVGMKLYTDLAEHDQIYSLTNETLRAVEYQLFHSAKEAWRTDEGQDFESIHSMSRSKEFTYDPNLLDEDHAVFWQKQIYDNISFEIAYQGPVQSVRSPGSRWGR